MRPAARQLIINIILCINHSMGRLDDLCVPMQSPRRPNDLANYHSFLVACYYTQYIAAPHRVVSVSLVHDDYCWRCQLISKTVL